VLAKEKDVVERKIQVYALCPGWVDTDMTSHKGPLTIQQGALTPVFLAELPF
jgi:carbonyl reductase 1